MKPIIFNGEMVKAILEGRKSQTRRVIKPQPTKIPDDVESSVGAEYWYPSKIHQSMIHLAGWELEPMKDCCPYGQVGDRLWVREKALYWDGGAGGRSDPVYQDDPEIPHLLEDNNRLLIPRTVKNIEAGENVVGKWVWKPSIHMYKEDSRITLEITDIRVERLQEISSYDIEREGLPYKVNRDDAHEIHDSEIAIVWFQGLWNSINAKRGYPWESNPWVWVISFKPV